jgi:hypothetical protein
MEELLAAALSLMVTLAGFSLVLASVYNAENAVGGAGFEQGRLVYVSYTGGYVYAFYQGVTVGLKTPVEVYANGSWTPSTTLYNGALIRAPSSDGRLVAETDRGPLVASP